ncbi:MAG TPA: pyridoxal-phosphate dependent enzyme [Ignavibacteriaceae bacterium]|nr:pyridoxal-phosphate dependent enzyme [Ignavibacteriaceae bacterium]
MKTPGKIKLANIPTPIEEITFENKKLLIKRDDLTGIELSGNKVRKLEYLLMQAKKEKADTIFTCGGEQSNHARATAIAAAKLGMKSKLFLWGKDNSSADGNLFIDKFAGAEISFLDKRNYSSVNEIMYEEREALLHLGKRVYVIPEGGSTTLGMWGYVDFVTELSKQINLKKIKGICVAAGTGGTAAGLLVGAALRNFRLKIYAVNVLYSKDVIEQKIKNLAEGCKLDFNLKCKIDFKNLKILDGYSYEGYKNIDDSKVKLISSFARSTGIILDPAYTGKAFKAYYEKFLEMGKGKQVIFLHTGGLFGVFGKRKKYLAV